ncbi:hypothetical protein V496_01481 [Pseudogymnoascus sp. VKM F-4515 (FW-2607)]|nr:hypothetical protein V496_01481 [Pseudogymnoascus sp. VKM F-4515 (FW-2607)]
MEANPSPAAARATPENAIRADCSDTRPQPVKSNASQPHGNTCHTKYCHQCGFEHVVNMTPQASNETTATSQIIRQQPEEQEEANHTCGDWCLYKTLQRSRKPVPWCIQSHEHVRETQNCSLHNISTATQTLGDGTNGFGDIAHSILAIVSHEPDQQEPSFLIKKGGSHFSTRILIN